MGKVHKGFFISLLVSCILMAGCGKPNNTQDNSTDLKLIKESEISYGSELITVPEQLRIISISAIKDSLYVHAICQTEDNEGEQYHEGIYLLTSLGSKEDEFKEVPLNLSDGESIAGMGTDSDGNLNLLTFTSVWEEEESTLTGAWVKKVDNSGVVLANVELTDILSGNNKWLFFVEWDDSGNLYVVDSNMQLYGIDRNGKQLFCIEAIDFNSFIKDKGGKVCAVIGNDNNVQVKELDHTKNGYGTSYDNVALLKLNVYAKGNIHDIRLATEESLIDYNLTTQEQILVVDWVDHKVNSGLIKKVVTLADGNFIVLEEDNSSSKLYFFSDALTKEDIVANEKTVLHYGCLGLDSQVNIDIQNFNINNSDYTIEIIDYCKDSDYTTGTNRLKAELAANTGPDIIEGGLFFWKELVEKGVLEDLNPYMEKDKELNREDYLENVLKAFETDGKLWVMPSMFNVLSLIAKTSDVGERPGWTIEECMDYIDSQPMEAEIFDESSRSIALSLLCRNSLGEFVDFENRTCNFEKESFYRVMQTTIRFNEEYDYDIPLTGLQDKVEDGQISIFMAHFGRVADMISYKGIFGEEITIIGYPSTADSGSYISPQRLMGINVASPNKEGAWEFLRTFITEEYQMKYANDMLFNFPIMKNALTVALEKELHQEGIIQFIYGDFVVTIPEIEEKDIDKVIDVINHLETDMSFDGIIMGILHEEIPAYWEGLKTDKEVVDIIQNRVQLYLSE